MDTASRGISASSLPGRSATDLARPGSRAVVVGTGTHIVGSALPDIPTVAATVTAVRDALRDQSAMDERHITPVSNPETPAFFLDAVDQAATEAEDVLLLYYIGHGLVSIEGELFLATCTTTDREVMLPAEALSFVAVRRVLSNSRARYVVVVLDCCFSGRASGAISAAAASAFELMNIHGSYLLSATSPTGRALAPEEKRCTAFSGALMEFLRAGTPTALPELTLDAAYSYLEHALPAQGAPAPQRRAGGDAGSLVVAVNPQAPPVTQPHDDSERIIAPVSSPRFCPYPGLGAFTAADARYFYGRERLVGEVLGVLADRGHRGPVAVVGRSGAGKSSLLQAGLLPTIKDGGLARAAPGSRHWPQVVMTPGEHPMEMLARRLAAGTVTDGLVLCVDQFEEVFTACDDEAERRAFIQSLCAAASRSGRPSILVILGLRADFYDRCLDYPELAPMVTAGQAPVRPMRREELKSAIEDPARVAGLRLREGLARRLLQDLESAEGPGRDADTALPLLAFALQETWKKSDKQVLTPSDYEATGGIWGAVTQRAEQVYNGVDPDAARLLLLSMVQLGDGTDDVRRRVNIEDLLTSRSAAEQEAVRSALDAYVAARLVTVDNGTAELAHEALLRAWPRLREWIKDDRAELLDRQRLAEAARVWKSGGGPLYTSDEVRNWPDREEDQLRRSLAPLERDFLRASARAERRRRNRRLSFITAAIAAALLLVAGGVYTVQQRAGNQASQAVESSVQLAQEADNLRATDPAGAMWLSLAAYNSSKTSQARTQLYDSLTTPYPVTLPGGGKGSVDSVAYSPDGRIAAAVWHDGIVRIWRVSDPLRPALVATLRVPAGGISRLAFIPEGGILAVHALGSLELWRLGAGHPALLSDTPIAEQRRTPPPWLPVAFSPDGRTIATGASDGRYRIWDVTDPARPALVASASASSRALTSVAFSPDGGTLAVANETSDLTGQDGQVRLWDVQDLAKPAVRTTLTVNSALSVAFSLAGHLLVAAGSNDDIYAWNVTDMNRPVSVQVSNGVNSGNDHSFYSVAFHPGSDVFVTADSTGMTEIWTGAPRQEISSFGGDLPDSSRPNSVAFSPGGQQIITGDFGGSVKIWTPLTSLLPGSINAANVGSPYNANGTTLVTDNPVGGNPSPIRLWDVSDPLHPVPDATLPGTWDGASFLPGGDTLATVPAGGRSIQLWNASDPRHPKIGAALPDNGTNAGGTWDASDNSLMLVADPHDVRLWDIRNIDHPVLDSAIMVDPYGEMGFLGDQMAAVNVKTSPTQSELKLWDITNPRHPVAGGEVPNGNPDSAILHISSQHVLTETDAIGNVTDTTLWSVRNLRKPSILDTHASMDPDAVNTLNDNTWVALTSDQETMEALNVSDPRKPAVTAAIPVGTGYDDSGLYTTASPGGWLAGAVFTLPSATGQQIHLMQVRTDGKAVSDYAQLPDSAGSLFTFSPDGKFLATDFDTSGGNGFEALDPQDPYSGSSLGILYPLDSDSLYQRLCSIATQTPPSPSWSKYLPATYYRSACS